MEIDEEAPAVQAGGSVSYSSGGASADGYVSGGGATVEGNVTEQFLPPPWGPDKDKVVIPRPPFSLTASMATMVPSHDQTDACGLETRWRVTARKR